MSTVNGKYLKDENSNIISPIVSTDTIYDTLGNPMGGGYCTNWYGTTICW